MTEQLLSIALGLGLAASVGFRIFVPLLALSAASYLGLWDLNENWEWLGSLTALITFSVATFVEILAYFIPFVDNLLDSISIPLATIAGTAIMVSTMVDMDPVFSWGLAIIAGGGTAAVIKTTMGTSRITSSLSTAGMGNPVISFIETTTAIIMSILSIFLPILAFVLVIVILVAGQSELAALPRAQAVLEGFLDVAGDDLDTIFEDGAPMLDTASPDVVEEVLRALADARADDRVDVRTLPVEPIGAGDDVVYQVDERGRAFAAEVLGAGTAASTTVSDGVRLEVLNGNGQVGVGAEVAELLVPLGHQIVITGNAESFDQDSTLVTVREDDEELLAAGREIVETLGVGRVSISSLPSTTVDITIVVGADWQGR